MHRFSQVDVFTDRPYAGNPLAVVHGAVRDAFTYLQSIMRESVDDLPRLGTTRSCRRRMNPHEPVCSRLLVHPSEVTR